MHYVFDIETNGLLYKAVNRKKELMPVADRVHCLVLQDVESGEQLSYGPTEIEQGLAVLQDAHLIGHNIMQYDLPLLTKFYGFTFDWRKVTDTLIWSRLACPDIETTDIGRVSAGRLPSSLSGLYSLKAWGYRLGFLKGDYGAQEGAWESYTPEMLEYCQQDVALNAKLYDKLNDYEVSGRAMALEHEVSYIISRQEAKGVLFDKERAKRLVEELSIRRAELQDQLKDMMDDIEKVEWFTPKRDNKTKGYKKGEPFKKVKNVPFNINSTHHIARNLQARGWRPTEFTPTGQVKVSEEVLNSIDLPEARKLAEHFMVNKRLAQISEGPANWFRMLDGQRIHGQVNPLGTVSARMSHNNPNLGQVPASYSPYGKACRACWIVPPGWRLVGCDADGLEMRGLGHFLEPYDGGAFIESATSGSKAEGTDPHSRNARLAECARDPAKTLFYAFLYGAGDTKLGQIRGGGRKLGADIRKRFERGITGLDRLLADLGRTLKARNGRLRGLDGRWLYCRSEHAALNLVIQGAGGILMKQALVVLHGRLEAELPSDTWYFVLNVHDEFQLEVEASVAERVSELAEASIPEAGRQLGFKCPLAATAAIGGDWSETH